MDRLRLPSLVFAVMLLSACDGPLSLLTGGGPNVAANVQAGAENRQTVVSNEKRQTLVRPEARTIEQSTGQTGVRSEKVETLVVQERVPAWIWISWALLLMLDSPLRWPSQIWKAIRDVRNN